MPLYIVVLWVKHIKKESEKAAPPPLHDGHFWRHLGDFGRPWADFGRHLGTSWAPRGSQNQPFWPQVTPKNQNMSPRMRHQKMYENLIKI